MRDLEEALAKLLETVRQLPPGPQRHELLKEVGRFRMMLDVIMARQEQQQAKK